MLGTCQILILDDHKLVIYSHVVGLLALENLQNRITDATSSNHVKLLAIHEARRECVWLRFAIQHIRQSCGLSNITDSPTILFEDN